MKKGIFRLGARVSSLRSKIVGAAITGGLIGSASAQTGTAPIDVADVSADIVAWSAAAVTAGVAVWLVPLGVRYVKRAFKAGMN